MVSLAQQPQHADRVLISVNPTAGSGWRRAAAGRLAQRLEQLGLSVEIVTDLEDLQSQVAQLQAEGRLRTVVAAGGDGTAAEMWNRLPAEVPITPLPQGTENLLARYLGLHRRIEDVAQAIAGGWHTWLDAGRANGRLFSLMFSCGFDAEVVRLVHGSRRGNLSRLSYFKPIVQAIRNYRYPRLWISFSQPSGSGSEPTEVSGSWISRHARWAFVFNLPCYATGLRFCPTANAADGKLNVCTFRKGGLASGLWYLSQLWLHRHQQMNDCRCWETPRLRIESDEPVPYQLDGDGAGMLPVEIQAVPQRLALMVPHAWAAGQSWIQQPQPAWA